ncbi:response regulator [Paracoccus suum]|uniref:Response regulator n=2 Tax=Paracoccus suum TaxID=2259340 RepID=A0A344PNP9_9RHOB|nr:response regulator [Paracoccus suum]
MQLHVNKQPPEHPPAVAAPARTAARPLAGLTVLVVEDSRVASEAVRLICLRSGARIRRADCLASARRHLATYRPAVVLVDMGLPDGDGAELIRAIAHIAPRVPVILGISGEPAARGRALAAGAQDFLTKPVESVAVFQQTILNALPEDARPKGPRILPTELVVPDAAALRDDLAHAATLLEDGVERSDRTYLGRFVAGVARSAHDAALEDAAEVMLSDQARSTDRASPMPAVHRLQALLRKRLSDLRAV